MKYAVAAMPMLVCSEVISVACLCVLVAMFLFDVAKKGGAR